MSERATPAGGTAQSRRASTMLFGLLAFVAIVVVLVASTLLFGLHTGEEFAPATFSRRVFYYYQVPLIGIQVSPIVRDSTPSSFANYLRDKKLIPATSEDTPRWDLVYAGRGGKIYFRGDADILCSYLDAADEQGNSYWKAWSEDNLAAARLLWPLVARLARRQLYILIPELIEQAQAETDPQLLERSLNRSLAGQYARLAAAQRELGNQTLAAELFGEALKYAPDDPDIRRSHDALLP
jgi:hypothetical protein